MTLRKRLVLGLLVILAVFAAGAVFAVLAQRSHLIEQTDDQLATTPLPPRSRPGPDQGAPDQGAADQRAPDQGAPDPNDPPISDLFLATIELGAEPVIIVEGQRLTDRPDLSAISFDDFAGRRFIDVDGENGTSRFRVMYLSGLLGDPVTVAAIPLDDVDSTLNQLAVTLGLVGLLIAAALAAITFWVDRLGVRPITEMTMAADAVASGDRTRRATAYESTTEAGRLSTALNVMLDERDESDDRLRRFVSDASHELRTPLTSLRGYLDLYASGGFRGPGELDDAVRRMQGESARMNLLVEDLLLLSKLDEQQPLDSGEIDIGTMLDDIAASVLVAHPGRSITVSASDDLLVRADPLRLHQAVAGIVDNAIVHTPDDAAVRLSGVRTESGIEIVIADDGPGLNPDDLTRRFDRFYRGDQSRSRAVGGSGLGLSITKSIIEAHGGTVCASSAPSEGATFTVTLPKG